jgi:hypothetical protein
MGLIIFSTVFGICCQAVFPITNEEVMAQTMNQTSNSTMNNYKKKSKKSLSDPKSDFFVRLLSDFLSEITEIH